MRVLLFLALPLVLAGCETVPPEVAEAISKDMHGFERNSPEWNGLKFARGRCSDCHAVELDQASPGTAPRFDAIANTPGLTGASLTEWLGRPHNYPDAMYFEIPAEHIGELVAYMLTLQSDNYEPPIEAR